MVEKLLIMGRWSAGADAVFFYSFLFWKWDNEQVVGCCCNAGDATISHPAGQWAPRIPWIRIFPLKGASGFCSMLRILFSGFYLQTYQDNSRERAHENCGGCCKSTESSPQFKNISLVFWEFKRALKSTQLGCSSFPWVFSWDPARHWTAWHCTKSPETDYLQETDYLVEIINAWPH